MTQVWISAAGLSIATMIGAFLGLFIRNLSHKWNDGIMGFCAGVMLAAAILGLLVPAVELAGRSSWWIVIVGEFPSMWEMRGGSETEISKLNGVKVIKMGDLSEIMPLVKENPYLKEEFTIEFDVWSQQVPSGSSTGSYIEFAFESAKDKIAQMTICPATMSAVFRV